MSSKTSDEDEEELISALYEFFDLVYYYAKHIYGVTTLKRWFKANPHKSILDRFNETDIAFALVVYENYQPLWKDDVTNDAPTNGEKVLLDRFLKNKSSEDSRTNVVSPFLFDLSSAYTIIIRCCT